MSYILPSIESFTKAVEDFVQEHESHKSDQLCESCTKLKEQVMDICFEVQARGDWFVEVIEAIISRAGDETLKGNICPMQICNFVGTIAFMRGLDLGLRAMQQEMSEKVTKAIEVMEENYKEESKEE